MAEYQSKIQMRDVRKSFGPKTVLDGLNLDIKMGESVAVIGGSGVGKSVMLKCLLGLLQFLHINQSANHDLVQLPLPLNN